MSFRGLRTRLTYANVMSTVAVVLAVTGGATAIALSLPKNSVKSKQIAKEAVKNSDIAKDAVTGDKVKESTLGKVPSAAHADSATHADSAGRADTAGRADSAANADHAGVADTASVANALAGGLMPTSISKTLTASSVDFSTSLELKVPGYGSFRIVCETNTASATDDEAVFGYQNGLGPNAIEGGFGITQPFPYGATESFVVAGTEPTNGTFVNQDRRLYYHFSLALPGTTKAVVVEASGFDNEATLGCAGQIQAFVSS